MKVAVWKFIQSIHSSSNTKSTGEEADTQNQQASSVELLVDHGLLARIAATSIITTAAGRDTLQTLDTVAQSLLHTFAHCSITAFAPRSITLSTPCSLIDTEILVFPHASAT